MAVFLSPVGIGFQWLGQTGLVLAGGKINTYAAGTTTPQATYTDNTGTVPNANPIILDSTGRYAQEIWLTGGISYKFVITDALNVTQFTLDNIYGIGDLIAPNVNSAANISYTPPGTGAITTTVGNKLSQGELASIKDFGAKVDGSTDDTSAINAALTANAGGMVFCNPGVSIFSGPIQIPDNTTLFGVYGQSTLRIASGAWTGTNFPLPPITNSNTSSGQNVVVRNLVLDANSANVTQGAPGVVLSFRGTLSRYEVSNCIFANYPGAGGSPAGGAPVGLGVSGGTNAINDGLVLNNLFLNTNGGAIVVFGNRNRIIGNSQPQSATDASIGVQGPNSTGNYFSGNYVRGCNQTNRFPFYVEGASGNTFIGNTMDNCNGIIISDLSLAKPVRNVFIGNSFINSPAGVPPINFVQTGGGFGASDNIVVFNMGPDVSTDPAYNISGVVGKNSVIMVDQGNAFFGLLDTVAASIKWFGMDTQGRLAFMNNAKGVLTYLSESGYTSKNAVPYLIEDTGGTARACINISAGNNLEIGGGLIAGSVIMPNLDTRWQQALVALGGGAAPTLGTIGGSGPATAAQNSWKRFLDNNGVAFWVPVWK